MHPPLHDDIGDTTHENQNRQSCASLWSWDAVSSAAIHASGTATRFTTVVTRKYVGDIKCAAAGPAASTSTAFLAIAAIAISSTATPTCAVRDSRTTALDFANKGYVADFGGFSRNICAGRAARPWTT